LGKTRKKIVPRREKPKLLQLVRGFLREIRQKTKKMLKRRIGREGGKNRQNQTPRHGKEPQSKEKCSPKAQFTPVPTGHWKKKHVNTTTHKKMGICQWAPPDAIPTV